MRQPTLMGGVLLVYLLVLLPWMAYRSALRMRNARAGTATPGVEPLPPLTQIFAGTLTLLGAFFLIARFSAGQYHHDRFWYETIGPREIGAGVAELRCPLCRPGHCRITQEWLYVGGSPASGIYGRGETCRWPRSS